jgi:hypothetical protein
MSEQLTNIPQGFKVAAARFRAIAVDDLQNSRVEDSGGTPGNNFFVEVINVQSDNAEDFADQFGQMANRNALLGGSLEWNDGQDNGRGR